ncbi:MAG TPA: rhodanese-like domain-containing protein [Blastocatellia bacterium]|nr:rhodanese-like domain-containing protein [Blastocatellia bacterium]
MTEVSAQEAYDMMQGDARCIYLDVRSLPEFEAGHPAGSVNIPIMHFTPGVGMSPNAEFASVVAANLPKDAPIVVGCKSGVRSARACEAMTDMGYTNVANVRGGFGGAIDNFGRVVEPGWSTLGLPISTECGDDARYEVLAAKAR